jgi:integrase
MGHRDAKMILVAYRHGLRASELCALRWDQVDLERGLVHVRRLKNGTPSVHPIGGTEKVALVKAISDPNFPLTAYSSEHCASDILALRLPAVGKDKSRRIYENQSSYGTCLNPAVASFREFPASRAEKFLGRHMERIVGRQGSHVDNDLRESGRKLRIPGRVHAGSKEQSDAEKSYLHKQWDHRYAHKNQQDDCICYVAQFAGRRDCPTDQAVESPPLFPSGLSCISISHKGHCATA